MILALLLALCQPAEAAPDRRTARLLSAAQAALDDGDPGVAFRKADAALLRDPTSVDAHYLRASAMLRVAGAVPDPADQEQILAAISADLAFVAAREPQSLRGGIARDFLARRRATPGAFALPEPRYPCSAEAEAALATAESLARAAPRDADDAYARALSLCPTNALGWTWYGDLYFAQANYQRATELYSRGLRVDPLLAAAYRYRADAAAALGQPEAARLDLLRAIAADPTYEAAWGALGSLQGARGGQLHRPTPPPVRYDPQSGELLVDQVGEQALPAGDLAASYVFAVVDAGRPPAGMSLPPGLPGPDRPAIERRRAALRVALDVFAAGEARPQTAFWALAVAAQAEQQLDAFLFAFLMNEAVSADFLRWRVEHHEDLVRFLAVHVAPLP